MPRIGGKFQTQHENSKKEKAGGVELGYPMLAETHTRLEEHFTGRARERSGYGYPVYALEHHFLVPLRARRLVLPRKPEFQAKIAQQAIDVRIKIFLNHRFVLDKIQPIRDVEVIRKLLV
jgi:hypothetical protein